MLLILISAGAAGVDSCSLLQEAYYFYVSPTGNDESNNGTFDFPFATIRHVLSTLNALPRPARVTVYFQPGTYYLPSQTTIRPGDQIVHHQYRFVGNSQVIFHGGIPLNNWVPYGSFWKSDVSTLPADWSTASLWSNLTRATRNRFPHRSTFSRIRSANSSDSSYEVDETLTTVIDGFDTDTLSKTDLVIQRGSCLLRQPIQSYSSGRIWTAPGDAPCTQPVRNDAVFIDKLPLLRSEPGTWFFNATDQTILYSPHQTDILGETAITVSHSLFDVDSIDNIQFKNIEFRFFGRKGITVTHSNHVEFHTCRFHHAETDALFLNANHSVVDSCDFDDIGGSGVVVCGDNVTVTDSFIVGTSSGTGDGVSVHACATEVWIANNEISGFSGHGISARGSKMVLRGNHVHGIGTGIVGSADGIEVSSPDGVVEKNHVHDVVGRGINLHGECDRSRIVGNVVHDVSGSGLYLATGAGHFVGSNVFALANFSQICLETQLNKDSVLDFEGNTVLYEKGELFYGAIGASSRFLFDRNTFYRIGNSGVNFKGANFAQWQAAGQDANSRIADPGFVDWRERDFRRSTDDEWTFGPQSDLLLWDGPEIETEDEVLPPKRPRIVLPAHHIPPNLPVDFPKSDNLDLQGFGKDGEIDKVSHTSCRVRDLSEAGGFDNPSVVLQTHFSQGIALIRFGLLLDATAAVRIELFGSGLSRGSAVWGPTDVRLNASVVGPVSSSAVVEGEITADLGKGRWRLKAGRDISDLIPLAADESLDSIVFTSLKGQSTWEVTIVEASPNGKADEEPNAKDSSGLSVPAIAGIAVGGVVLLAAIAVLVVVLVVRQTGGFTAYDDEKPPA